MNNYDDPDGDLPIDWEIEYKRSLKALSNAKNKMNNLENKLIDLKEELRQVQQKSFSKIVLSLVLSTYFVGLLLGIFISLRILLITPDYSVQAFIALLSYIGAPTSVTIGFYSWKAKSENVLKIPQEINNYKDDNEQNI